MIRTSGVLQHEIFEQNGIAWLHKTTRPSILEMACVGIVL